MYTIDIEFNDYRGTKKHQEIQFNLDAREVFKMLVELKSIFEWLESNRDAAEKRTLSEEEVVKFYTDFEGILLTAWGEMSDDGLYFKKSGKYDFEESAMFSACMYKFVNEPQLMVKMLEGVMPAELWKTVQTTDAGELANMQAKAKAEDQSAEIARLKKELEDRDNAQ